MFAIAFRRASALTTFDILPIACDQFIRPACRGILHFGLGRYLKVQYRQTPLGRRVVRIASAPTWRLGADV